MEAHKSIFDEIRETGEDVGIYGVSSKTEHPRRVEAAVTYKAMPKYLSKGKGEKSKADKENMKKKVLKCTMKGCKKCPPENSDYSSTDGPDGNISYNYSLQTGNPMTAPSMHFPEYSQKYPTSGHPYPERLPNDPVLYRKYVKPKEFEAPKYNQNGKTASQGSVQMIESKASANCANAECKGCLTDNTGSEKNQLLNSSKLEKYDHNKMSEVEFEDMRQFTDKSPADHPGMGSGPGKGSHRPYSPLVKTTPVIEDRSSQDLKPEQICLKMKNEENLAPRSIPFKTNPEKVHSRDIVWPISQNTTDHRKSSEKTVVNMEMNFQMLPKEQISDTWSYSRLSTKCNWRGFFLLVVLVLILVVIGILIFMIDFNVTHPNDPFNQYDEVEKSESIT